VGESGYSPAQERFLETKRGSRLYDVPGAGLIRPGLGGASTEVVPEDTIGGGIREREYLEREGADTAAGDVKDVRELPAQIEADADYLSQVEKFMGMLESGELKTGPGRGKVPALTTNEQIFEAFSNENIIDSISEATFGALSEGELGFLTRTNISRNLTPEANLDILQRKYDIIKRAQLRAMRRINAAGGEGTADITSLLEKYGQ
jgi:hypothetical protein